MKLPTMEDLYIACGNGAIVDWHISTAFYHGYMAALDDMSKQKINGDHYGHAMDSAIRELRDIANADMASELGG